MRPRDYDDHFVRSYRQFLLECQRAYGDGPLWQSLKLRWPDLFPAHELHFSPDQEWRDILQARLLTREPLAAIAQRFDVALGVIECYEKLFFNVCDRLDCRDWIAKIIRGDRDHAEADLANELSANQRAFAFRWFAYCGGPLVLDVIISIFSPEKMPPSPKDSAAWFDDSLRQSMRTRATLAVRLLDLVGFAGGIAERSKRQMRRKRRRGATKYLAATTP